MPFAVTAPALTGIAVRAGGVPMNMTTSYDRRGGLFPNITPPRGSRRLLKISRARAS
ncbi:MAG TPA: hypothetical protein VN408_23425 [Actinoplanes sp.]|nr:hypothetical protein [Actinoplanes sp.]